eukprot:15467523-Alexandrium_andersonii.AAC.1
MSGAVPLQRLSCHGAALACFGSAAGLPPRGPAPRGCGLCHGTAPAAWLRCQLAQADRALASGRHP